LVWRKISISDESYSRLAALKREDESFTDIINGLTGKGSIIELKIEGQTSDSR